MATAQTANGKDDSRRFVIDITGFLIDMGVMPIWIFSIIGCILLFSSTYEALENIRGIIEHLGPVGEFALKFIQIIHRAYIAGFIDPIKDTLRAMHIRPSDDRVAIVAVLSAFLVVFLWSFIRAWLHYVAKTTSAARLKKMQEECERREKKWNAYQVKKANQSWWERFWDGERNDEASAKEKKRLEHEYNSCKTDEASLRAAVVTRDAYKVFIVSMIVGLLTLLIFAYFMQFGNHSSVNPKPVETSWSDTIDGQVTF